MKKNAVVVLIALEILSLSAAAFTQDLGRKDPFSDFPEFIEGLMSQWRIPGMAIGVVRDGEIIYLQGFGYRDLESKLPVTTKPVFRIGSIAKSFTSTSVAILVDEGKLKWDTPVIEYLPVTCPPHRDPALMLGLSWIEGGGNGQETVHPGAGHHYAPGGGSPSQSI